MKNRLQRKHSTLFFKTRKFNRLPLKTNIEKNKNPSSFLTQAAIIVLLLTTLAYLFTAFFKGGYHNYYHLNALPLLKLEINDLISFFLTSFKYIVVAVGWYIFVFVLWMILIKLKIASKELFKQIHYTIIILVVIYSSLSCIFDLQNHLITQILFFGPLIFISLYSYLPKNIHNTVKFLTTHLYSCRYLVPIGLFIFFCFSSYELGSKTAKQQKSYLTFTKDNIDYVVISNNTNNLISVPLNADGTINPNFKVTSQTENLLFKSTFFPNGIQVGNPKELK